jgi:hypothetical protein
MYAVFGLRFDGTVDLTAIGTLLLAFATFVSVLVAFIALRRAQELSREEIEHAHRPVLVPIVDHQRMDLGPLGSAERRPKLAGGGLLIIPVENIGAGPALHLEASVAPLDSTGRASPTVSERHAANRIAGVAKGSFVALEIVVPGWTAGTGFALEVTYEDVAAARWRTQAQWKADGFRWDAVEIEQLAYELKARPAD